MAFCGSTRTGSFNQTVLDLAVGFATEAGADVDALSLRDFPMSLYNADDQERDGVPATAHALHERIVAADGVLVASPEYNGSFTPLLKNTVDWLSRIDWQLFQPKLMGLIAVTPGGTAGERVRAQTTEWWDSMALTVHEPFAVGRCREKIIDGVLEDEADIERLREWIPGYVRAVADFEFQPVA